MDEQFENLKRELLHRGIPAIEDFLGEKIGDEDEDVIQDMLNDAYESLSDKELEVFYTRYGIV